MVYSSRRTIDPNSIDKETTRAFKKVKFDIEELRRLVNTKQDKQTNVLIEMNNMRSELKIEFREELLELQRSMSQEIDALRQEVLYYREMCEQHRMDHHKVKVVEEVSKPVSKEPVTEKFMYETVEQSQIREEPARREKAVSNTKTSYYKPTPESQNFDNNGSKKTYLKWITVGDSDLDSIDEVIVK